MGLNTSLVGKGYPETSYQVTREAMTAYAKATNEDNPLLAGPAAEMASPMFAVVWLAEPMMQCLFDGELIADANIGRMVHGGQDMRFLSAVGPGDELVTGARVERIEDKSTGQILTIAMSSRKAAGEKVLEAKASFFFRGPPDPARSKPNREDGDEPGEPSFTRRFSTDSDQTHRYAEASGDRNPIHTDGDTARMMGFDGIIVHGLCTMALAQKAVLDGAIASDARRLRRLKVQFAKPVYPEQELEFRAWRRSDSRLEFLLRRISDGVLVLREGLAEFDED